MKPLQGPVNTVGGMIDQVTDEATGMVDSAEKTTVSKMGSGAKLMSAMGIEGKGGQGQGASNAAGGKDSGQAKGSGGKEGGKEEGGGDFFGTIKSGIHNNLMALGRINLKKLGTQILAAGAAKVVNTIRKMLTPKVKFKLGNEEHQLWVEQDKNRNSVMMASSKGTEIEENLEASRILAKSGELRNKLEKTEKKQNEPQVSSNMQALKQGLQDAGKGESVKSGESNKNEGQNGGSKDKENSNGGNRDKEGPDGESETNPNKNLYRVYLNKRGNIEGDFANFDWTGYNFTASPHPANTHYKLPNGSPVKKPTGRYELSGNTKGNIHTDSWREKVDDEKGSFKDGLISYIEQYMDNSSTAKEQLLIKLNKKSNSNWQEKTISELLEDGAKLQVEQKYKMGWQDIYLLDWSEHHIHPVNWGGPQEHVDNLQYLRNKEHSPISGWWESRKALLNKLVNK
jgi:hypothetical protein